MGKIKLTFDKQGNIEIPTLVLCRQNCSRIGAIPNVQNFVFSDNFGNAAEMSFTVHKNHCSSIWSSIKDFRNVYVPEWNTFFQLKVDTNESTSTSKSITATHLAEVELSNVLNPALEIYTETDIDYQDPDDSVPTVFYNKDNIEKSALHRILKVAVNYEIDHVDESLWGIFYEISETNQYVYDTLVNLGTGVNCHFEFDVFIDKETGKIRRTISAYDLESVCNECGCREEFNVKCPECGSTNFTRGYGDDTTIFVSKETLADSITFTTQTDQVKNCFYLEAGDDDVTADVINCNPNGTQWLWYLSDQDKEDMSNSLRDSLYGENGYYELYDYFENDHEYTKMDYDLGFREINPSYYNSLVTKYLSAPFNFKDLEKIETPIIGYPALTNAYYNVVDMEQFLTNTMMPAINISYDTSAQEQEGIIRDYLVNNVIGVDEDAISEVSGVQANNVVKSMAEALVDSRYKVKVSEYSYTEGSTSGTWKLYIENYSNEEDIYTSETDIVVKFNVDYETFLKQKVKKVLEKGENKNYGIAALMNMSIEDLEKELHKYGVQPLQNIWDCVDGVVTVLADMQLTEENHKDLIERIQEPFAIKMDMIEAEQDAREIEVEKILFFNNTINLSIAMVHNKLDLEKFLGDDLWRELNVYRRESTYSNSNYIVADTNAKRIKIAKDFIAAATKELVKSATMQHTISSSFKNFMSMKEFSPLRDYFAIGNWLRIEVDEVVYKLRLLSYQLDFSDYQNMDVEFSDVVNIGDDFTDLHSVVENARTMGKTFNAVEKKATDGQTSYKVTNDWVRNGLDATLTQIVNSASNQTMIMDDNGMLFRRLNDNEDGYEPEQMKIINSSIVITKTGWKSISTAVGKFLYKNPLNGELTVGYGVNAETLVGELILGSELGIHNGDSSLMFNQNGLTVKNDVNTVIINPKSDSIFTIKSGDTNIISFDKNGNATFKGTIQADAGYFKGDITASSLELVDTTISADNVDGLADVATSGEYKDLKSKPDLTIYMTEDGEIQRGTVAEGSTGILIKKDGALTASNVIVWGKIYASGGTIGGWTIDTNRIYDDTSATNKAGINKEGNGQAFWAGGTDLKGDTANFRVSHDGSLYANGADITGTITATSGKIGDVEIRDGHLWNYDPNSSKAMEIGSGKIAIIDTNSADTTMTLFSHNWCSFIDGNIELQLSAHEIAMLKDNSQWLSIYDNSLTLSGTLTVGGSTTISGSLAVNVSTTEYGVIKCIETTSTGALYLGGKSVVPPDGDSGIRSNGDGTYNCGHTKIRWGTVFSKNGVDTTSDEREKDILDFDLSEMSNYYMSLNPIAFRWKSGNDDKIHFGLGAQSSEKKMKECGYKSNNFSMIQHSYFDEPTALGYKDRYSMNYQELQMLTMMQTQKNTNEIDELKQTIEELKEQIRQLK